MRRSSDILDSQSASFGKKQMKGGLGCTDAVGATTTDTDNAVTFSSPQDSHPPSSSPFMLPVHPGALRGRSAGHLAQFHTVLERLYSIFFLLGLAAGVLAGLVHSDALQDSGFRTGWRWLAFACVALCSPKAVSVLMRILVELLFRHVSLKGIAGLLRIHHTSVMLTVVLGLDVAAWAALFVLNPSRSDDALVKRKHAIAVTKALAAVAIVVASRALGKLCVSAMSSKLQRATFLTQLIETLTTEVWLKSLASLPVPQSSTVWQWYTRSCDGVLSPEAESHLRTCAPDLPVSIRFLLDAADSDSNSDAFAGLEQRHVQSGQRLSEAEVHAIGRHIRQHDLGAAIAEATGASNEEEAAAFVYWHVRSCAVAEDPHEIARERSNADISSVPKEAQKSKVLSDGNVSNDKLGARSSPVRKGIGGISKEDLLLFLPPVLANRAFAILDTSGMNLVHRTDFVRVFTRLLRERRALASSLGDSRLAVDKIDGILILLLGFIDLIAMLLLFGAVDILSLMVTLSSGLLASAFVLGPALQRVFESAITLIGVHPFDVADAIEVNDEYYIVLELGLYTTVLQKAKGNIVFVPNDRLFTTNLTNLSRSRPLWRWVDVSVDMTLSHKQLSALELSLKQLAASDPANFTTPDSAYLVVNETSEPFKLKLTCFFELTTNGSDLSKRNRAHSRMFMRMARCLTEELHVDWSDTHGAVLTNDGEQLSLHPNNFAYEGAQKLQLRPSLHQQRQTPRARGMNPSSFASAAVPQQSHAHRPVSMQGTLSRTLRERVALFGNE